MRDLVGRGLDLIVGFCSTFVYGGFCGGITKTII